MRGTIFRTAFFLMASIGASTWTLEACVGDDPGSGTSPTNDGGGDGSIGTGDDASSGGDAAQGDSGCGDTTASASNCGACGHACPPRFSCVDSKCGNDVVQIVASRDFPPTSNHAQTICAALRSGALYCWGDNASGELGYTPDGGAAFADFAGLVAKTQGGADFGGVVDVAASEDTTCTVNAGGAGFCWGDNSFGEYGNGGVGSGVNFPESVIDAGGTPLVHLAATLAAFCGIDNAGAVWCWGYNNEDELGHDKSTDVGPGPGDPSPTRVVFPFGSSEKVTQIVGGPVHACALTDSSHVYCWGHDQWGNIGALDASDPEPTPLLVLGPNGETAGLGGVVELTTGSDYTCARTVAKTAYCWGYGGNGNLGNGASTNVNPLPVQVKGPGGTGVLAGVDGIAAGWFHACALVTGNVYCWGTNAKGELGIGTPDGTVRNTPTTMVVGPTGGTTTLSGVASIFALRESTCVVKTDNTVWCWGENAYDATHAGYLGNADPNHADSPYPVQVVGLP